MCCSGRWFSGSHLGMMVLLGCWVCEEIFGGRGRMEIEDAGFEGVLEVAGKMVEEVVRY